MAMELRQVPKLLQRLVITPRMQLSLKLLQMNRLELETLTRQELEQNPFLDTQEIDAGVTEPRANAEGISSPPPSRVQQVADSIRKAEGDNQDKPEENYSASFKDVDMDWDDYYSDSENSVYTYQDEESERTDFTQYTASQPSLYEHLLYQLRISGLTGTDYKIGEFILGSLNNDGFLKISLDEIAENVAASIEEVERVLGVIQTFSPTGIAARSTTECLALQLEDRGITDPLYFQILDKHFENLVRRKYDIIARELGVKRDHIEQVYTTISHLDPRPARNYTKEPTHYIQPDVIVEKDNDGYNIYLNDDMTNHLKINSYYHHLLHSKRLDKEERSYAEKKYNAAMWLIKNIERRRETILKVSRAIMDMQREFLDKGIDYLKPMTLREIAERVGMHESTVQRVTTGKYVQTPRGLYELKFFFSSSVERSDGESASSTSVKDRISNIIGGEDSAHPYSDQKIAELLKKEGINVARRTVAKYREQLKILPAKFRRNSH